MDTPIQYVIFPGGPGLGAQTLEPLVSNLSDAMPVQAISMPADHSLSNTPFKTYDDIVEWLLQEYFLDGQDYVLIGHSYGAIYAASIAIRLKERLRGFVAIAAPLTSSLKKYLDSYQLQLINLSVPFREAWDDYTNSPSPESYWQISKDAFLKLEEDMGSLPCPKLSILGSDDQLTPFALACTDMERLGFEVHRVPGGHLPYIENNDTELCILEWVLHRVLQIRPRVCDPLDDLSKHELRLIELLTPGPMIFPYD